MSFLQNTNTMSNQIKNNLTKKGGYFQSEINQESFQDQCNSGTSLNLPYQPVLDKETHEEVSNNSPSTIGISFNVNSNSILKLEDVNKIELCEDVKNQLMYSDDNLSNDHIFFVYSDHWPVLKHKKQLQRLKKEIDEARLSGSKELNSLEQKIKEKEKQFVQLHLRKNIFDQSLPTVEPLAQHVRDNIYKPHPCRRERLLLYNARSGPKQVMMKNKLSKLHQHMKSMDSAKNKYINDIKNYLYQSEREYLEKYMVPKTSKELERIKINKDKLSKMKELKLSLQKNSENPMNHQIDHCQDKDNEQIFIMSETTKNVEKVGNNEKKTSKKVKKNKMRPTNDNTIRQSFNENSGKPWLHELTIANKKQLMYTKSASTDNQLFWVDTSSKEVYQTKWQCFSLKQRFHETIAKGIEGQIKIAETEYRDCENYFISTYVNKVQYDENLPNIKPLPLELRNAIYNEMDSIYRVQRGPQQGPMLKALKNLNEVVRQLIKIGNKFAPNVANYLYHKELEYKKSFLHCLDTAQNQEIFQSEISKSLEERMKEIKQNKIMSQEETLRWIVPQVAIPQQNTNEQPKKKKYKQGFWNQGEFREQTSQGTFQNQCNQNGSNMEQFKSQSYQRGSTNKGNSGGFQNQWNQGGFQNQPNQWGFENQSNQWGFENQSNQIAFQNQPHQMGFQNQSNEWGCQNQPNQMGYRNQSNDSEWGLQNQSNQMGFRNQSIQGGFQKEPNQIGFQNQSNQSGFQSQTNHYKQNQYNGSQFITNEYKNKCSTINSKDSRYCPY